MKLSRAQSKVMEEAKRKIDFARTHSLREWAEQQTNITPEFVQRQIELGKNRRSEEETRQIYDNCVRDYMNNYGRYYEDCKRCIVLCSCVNSRSLQKLESLALIKIMYDSSGESVGIDTIKVLNY